MLAEALIRPNEAAQSVGIETIEQQLQRALKIARSHFNMDFGFISEFTNGRRYFRYIDTELASCPISVGGSDPLEESYCQRVVDGRLPEVIPDACQNPEALTLPATRALPVGGHLSVPLRLKNGNLFGTLCCFSYRPDLSLNERDLGVLRAFGAIVAEMIGEAAEHRAVLEERHQHVQAIEEQLRQAVKMEAVGQLTGGIAHDFNNLLGIVVANLDMMLEDESLRPDLKECAEHALGGALRGAELTRRLLSFSRKQPLKTEVVNPNTLIENSSAMLRRTLGGNVLFEIEPGADVWPVRVDAAQLDEAILNLAINARDAMSSGGLLTIRTENVLLGPAFVAANAGSNVGDYVKLTVKDTGSGMPPEVRDRCFEPFFTTKGVGKGTGLGLSMVYGFVKQSGGYASIESEPGRGTSINIYLPRVQDQAVATARGGGETRSPRGAGQIVLVVDDDAELRTTVVRQLDGLGYRTLEAADAATALQTLEKIASVAVLFGDLVMPGGMTGLELARRASAQRPGLKIILSSGHAGLVASAADAEQFSLLNKPYRREELARRLKEVLAS